MGLIKLRNLARGLPEEFTGEHLLAVSLNHKDFPYETRSYTCDQVVSGGLREFRGLVAGANFTEYLQLKGENVATGVIEDAKVRLTDGQNNILGEFTANQKIDIDITALPTASNTIMGGIKIGNGLISSAGGTVSVDHNSIPIATTTNLGVVQVGNGLKITAGGVLSAEIETLPIASNTALGAIKVGGGLVADSDGTLSLAGWNNNEEGSVYTSDERLKSEIKAIEDPIDIISQIEGVRFKWNKDSGKEKIGKPDIGVLAQEVQKVMPEAVESINEEYLGVSYHKIIPVLIECIKKQEKRISDLEKILLKIC